MAIMSPTALVGRGSPYFQNPGWAHVLSEEVRDHGHGEEDGDSMQRGWRRGSGHLGSCWLWTQTQTWLPLESSVPGPDVRYPCPPSASPVGSIRCTSWYPCPHARFRALRRSPRGHVSRSLPARARVLAPGSCRWEQFPRSTWSPRRSGQGTNDLLCQPPDDFPGFAGCPLTCILTYFGLNASK